VSYVLTLAHYYRKVSYKRAHLDAQLAVQLYSPNFNPHDDTLSLKALQPLKAPKSPHLDAQLTVAACFTRSPLPAIGRPRPPE
jgi:hypothetical protein